MVSERKAQKDPLGVLMKDIEKQFTGERLDVNNYIVARLDGRGFSKFTKGMARPYDARLTKTMRDVTEALMLEFGPYLGYTQSDEISLAWMPHVAPAQFMFDGKIQKLTSVLAGFCSSAFVLKFMDNFGYMPTKVPHFDCRIMDMSAQEASDMFKWRRLDARKNAVQMVAQSYFSHKKLQGANQETSIRMLKDEGVIFDEFPEYFRLGTTMTREMEMVELTEVQMLNIPHGHRPEGPVPRTIIKKSCEMLTLN